jgi:alkylated DNA repair dioxygenase AlkB
MKSKWQIPLFPTEEEPAPSIPGFSYVPNFITSEAEGRLIKEADLNPWDTTWKRRIQQYGFSYSGSRRESLGEMPEWLSWLSEKLHKEGIFQVKPNQVIINEYLPGQGIASHSDYVSNYGDTVASLSLGSPIVMDFTSPDDEKFPFLLEPRSLFVLCGPARYDWKHGIAPRKTDKYGGAVLMRGRRLSCTFRNHSNPE